MTDAKKSSSKNISNKIVEKIALSSEREARLTILEDLFYDFHSSRSKVYKMNFMRGLFFGFGSAIGATLLIALTIWLLIQFGNIFPPLADFMNQLVETMQNRQ